MIKKILQSIYLIFFNKNKSKTLIKRASEEEKIRVYADKINTKTRSKCK